jgi:sigma-E factor negative regulatory protein RseC
LIEEAGTVVAIDGAYAQVQTERRSVCGGCSANGACGTSLLERFFGRRPIQVRALNTADALVGDRVILGISEQGLLSASIAVYLIPVAGLVAGAVLGETILGSLTQGRYADVSSLLGAALGFVLALSWLRAYSAASWRRPEHQAVVVCKVERGAQGRVVPGP